MSKVRRRRLLLGSAWRRGAPCQRPYISTLALVLLGGVALQALVPASIEVVGSTAPAEPGSFPDASNTGYTSKKSELEEVGAGITSLAVAGAVVEGKHFTDQILVKANNVTVKNCLCVAATRLIVVKLESGVTGFKIEDVEIDGGNNEESEEALGGGGEYTAKRLNIHSSNDGFRIRGGCTIEDSYVHDLHTHAGAHTDCCQSLGGENMVVKHNTFIGSTGGNSSILMNPDTSAIDKVLIEHNYFDGPCSYMLFFRKGTGGLLPGKVTLKGNHFGRAYNNGPITSEATELIREGNVWADTLEAIPGG